MIENQVKKKRRRVFLFSIIALLLVCGSVYAYRSSALSSVDIVNKQGIEVDIPKGYSTSKI
ncbi:endolytic transglycosylase MltG, partial [Bacillus cereus]|nr:endolytic transglycosylase MltG [Bacillus cereus]